MPRRKKRRLPTRVSSAKVFSLLFFAVGVVLTSMVVFLIVDPGNAMDYLQQRTEYTVRILLGLPMALAVSILSANILWRAG